MDHKYISLVQNLESSNAQTISKLSHTIFELENRLRDLECANISLRKENEQLKNDIEDNYGPQIQQLEKIIVCK